MFKFPIRTQENTKCVKVIESLCIISELLTNILINIYTLIVIIILLFYIMYNIVVIIL